jgi:uncharacterized protein YndB with AHSA1/START domain
MSTFKKIVIAILVVLAIPFIVAFFVPSEYGIEKNITINQPIDSVFDYLAHIKNQEEYSVWSRQDPAMKKIYKGVDGTVGFVSRWESDSSGVGVGEQEIKAIDKNKRIDMELRFEKPFQATDYAYFLTTPIDSTQTQVVWGFKGKMPYPFNLFLLSSSFEKMLGDQLQEGLETLKKIKQ